jgi:release factor glutamine methyltransferase
MSKVNHLIQLKIAKLLLQRQNVYIYNYRELLQLYNLHEQFEQLINKIDKGYPLDYVLGKIEFLAQPFNLNDKILIPREETEWWVLQLQNLLLGKDSIFCEFIDLIDTNLVVDLGAGSGVIGLSLANLFDQVVLIEIERKALDTIQENISNLNIENALVIESNWIDNLDPNIISKPWTLLCNPPYVPISDSKNKKKWNIEFEPEGAIFSGEDGLKDFKTVLNQLQSKSEQKLIRLPEIAIFELDPRNILQAQGLFQTQFNNFQTKRYKDLNGVNRLLACRQLTTVN